MDFLIAHPLFEWVIALLIFGVVGGLLLDALGATFAVIDVIRGGGRSRR